MDASALSEIIKTKMASLIQEQLKPIVNELAAQHQMILTHSALLKYNHNVNDYQMSKLENLRDLEQSINFKVAGALAYDPWQHPTIGTNLREPVPADPRLIPRFTPEDQTPAERAVTSAELIAQAGVSARRLGVPLTLHDFPRDPAIHTGGENEDPMHAAVPLFGLGAPRWRAIEGLPPDTEPGLATYNGVPAPPSGKKGKKLYRKRAQKMKPKWKTFDAATAPKGPSTSSSSTLDALFALLDGPALAGPSGTSGGASTSGITLTQETPPTPSTSTSTSTAITLTTPPPVPTPPSLKRTRKAAGLEIDDEDDDSGASSSHNPAITIVPPLRTSPAPKVKQEPEEPEPGTDGLEPEPPRKRRRRSAAPSPSASFCLAISNTPDAVGVTGGWPGQPVQRQLRRSTRVTRAPHPYATDNVPAAAPAPRRRQTASNGKRARRS